MLYTFISLLTFGLSVFLFVFLLYLVCKRNGKSSGRHKHRILIEVDDSTENLDFFVDGLLKSFEKKFDDTLEITLVRNNTGEELEKMCEILSRKFDTVDSVGVKEIKNRYDD